jgi:hypothetical protein
MVDRATRRSYHDRLGTQPARPARPHDESLIARRCARNPASHRHLSALIRRSGDYRLVGDLKWAAQILLFGALVSAIKTDSVAAPDAPRSGQTADGLPGQPRELRPLSRHGESGLICAHAVVACPFLGISCRMAAAWPVMEKDQLRLMARLIPAMMVVAKIHPAVVSE